MIEMRAIILVFVLILPGLVDAQSVAGSITRVYWPGGEISGDGYSGSPTVEIENTGSEPHEFYVQISVQDPTGKWHAQGAWFLHTDTIAPGKKDNFRGISIRVSPHYDKMPVGKYNGKVDLYADFYKHDKLDSQTQRNAFDVDT
jgi:hypothetical protein